MELTDMRVGSPDQNCQNVGLFKWAKPDKSIHLSIRGGTKYCIETVGCFIDMLEIIIKLTELN